MAVNDENNDLEKTDDMETDKAEETATNPNSTPAATLETSTLTPEMKEEVQAVATQAAEEVQQIVTAQAVEQAVETAVQAVQQEVAAQVDTKVAEAIAAQAIETKNTPTENTHLTHNLLDLAKSQSRMLNIFMLVVIIGLMSYIAFDKLRNDRQANDFAETVMSPISEIFKADEETLIVPDAYQKIVQKQAGVLEQKNIGDSNIKETIYLVLTENKNVEDTIQANIDSLKRRGLSDKQAIPQAFLIENVIAAVLAELPAEINSLPQIQDLIKEELKKISSYAERELNSK